MTDRHRLLRLFAVSAALLLVSAGAALAFGRPALAGGLALGFALGLAPFASWAWIASRGLESHRNRLLAVLVILAKLGLYAAALYVALPSVEPAGVFGGVTGVVGIFSIGLLLAPSPRPKEAA
jgi:hypothetical protein